MNQFHRPLQVFIVLGAVVVITLPFILWSRTSGIRQGYVPPDAVIRPTPEDMVAREVTSPGGNTTRGDFAGGRYYISIIGVVAGEPSVTPDAIGFDFNIHDDPDRHILPVRVAASEGVIPVGEFDDSFEGVYTTRLMAPDDARAVLRAWMPLQLRFMYVQDTVVGSTDKDVQQALLSLLTDSPKIPSGITLSPAGFGLIR